MLTETASTKLFELSVTEADVLERIHRGLLVEGAPVGAPPRQNSCRLHRPTQGAAMKDGLGSIRTGIQGQGGSEVAAAGERITGRGVA
jgi:hypothetical protein